MEMHHFGRPPYPSQIFPTLSVPLPSAHPSLHPSAHHGIQPGYHAATSIGPLEPRSCKLIIRQQPLEALVTQDGKEKTRKPVDPPPILELSVDKHDDPQEQFLQNPYIFVCVKLIKAEREEAVHNSGDKALTGTLVSSLHRLKDVNNKDGGFFVFGDISVRVQGSFRLHFSLYEFDKDRGQVQMLSTISSERFRVLQPKDFKGMEESTYLSRAFSDQGVRLRLRKEPRGVMGNKRSYPFSESPNTPIRPNNAVEYGAQYQDTSSPNKKFKSDPEDRKDSFPIQPQQPQQPQHPQHPHPPPPVMFRRQASLATPYTMASYAPLPQTHYTMGSSAMQLPYSVGPSMGGTGMSGSSMSGSSMSGSSMSGSSMSGSSMSGPSMSGSSLYSNSPTYYNTNGAASNVDQPNFYSQFPDTSYASQGGLGL